jgi:hypothetical protein
MRSTTGIVLSLILLTMFVFAGPAHAQRGTGELRLQIRDETGAAVQASGTLEGQATRVRRTFTTNAKGTFDARELPFGLYALTVEARGFAPATSIVDVRSEIPQIYPVTLTVAPLSANVTVNPSSDTLLDPYRPSSAQFIGFDLLRDRPSAMPGRSIVDLVNTQPGWLLEANGILHPRASEYQVQYVIDGIPLRDNRSPAFAQSLGIDEFQTMTVRTSGYPAEFGGKLGGVIELTTLRESREGLHGSFGVQTGSFSTVNGTFSTHYVKGGTSAGVSVEGMRTDRYLDPPVEQNFTNHGSGGAISFHADRTWSDRDRTRLYADYHHTRFDVPNEALQQAAGQRQDRDADEALAQLSHDRIFSSNVLGSVRLMIRDDTATLGSNAASFPIIASQDRGLREAYTNASLSLRHGSHEIKFGGEAIFGTLREQFASTIVNRRPNGIRVYDGDIPLNFTFDARHAHREQALFAQDQLRVGSVTLAAGLRYDHYALMVHEHALSPRVSAAWYVPSANLTVHATYDRAFQTPPLENILLASTDLVSELGGEGSSLPLRSSRANFYEAGLSKAFGGKLRLDANYYHRHGTNFGDDELLLNTAVSFPIAFSQGTVKGFEAKIDVPRWGAFSGWFSYALAKATGRLPLSGGLFLGDEVNDQLESTETFPISQDQRHTLRGRIRYQLAPRAWIGLGAQYNSGLPVEIEGTPNLQVLIDQYGQAIVDRVDFDRGRVHASASIDFSAGIDLWRTPQQSGRLQFDFYNLNDRLNVINFAGLLSGTAVGPRRTLMVRMQAGF